MSRATSGKVINVLRGDRTALVEMTKGRNTIRRHVRLQRRGGFTCRIHSGRFGRMVGVVHNGEVISLKTVPFPHNHKTKPKKSRHFRGRH